MAWSKSDRKGEKKAASDREISEKTNGEGSDTKRFVAEMESRLSDFDTRLEQRKQDLALAQADIAELERLIDAAKQAIGAAEPKNSRPAISVVDSRSATSSGASH
jgi:hypothetical protein